MTSWIWLIPALIVLPFGLVVLRGAPYVPSRKTYLNQAFDELYEMTERDVLVDIGSGGGVVLREASKRGARAVGYELNPILAYISRFISRKDKNVTIRIADFWSVDLPDDMTVVYVFSVTRDMKKIIDKMQYEADRLNRSIYLINYGSELKGIKIEKQIGAYKLYIFNPLQSDKAQV